VLPPVFVLPLVPVVPPVFYLRLGTLSRVTVKLLLNAVGIEVLFFWEPAQVLKSTNGAELGNRVLGSGNLLDSCNGMGIVFPITVLTWEKVLASLE
jgi:hypothetical protein